MNKRIFFLAGFPRSGATLLSSILEQNENIHCPPASPLINVFSAVHSCYASGQNLEHDRSRQIYNVMDSIAESFFKDRPEPIIIDKNWVWVQELPSDMIYRHITQNIRFICPVRDISEIVNSFLNILNKTEDKDNLMDSSVKDLYGEINNDNRTKYIIENLISNNYKILKERSQSEQFRDSFLIVPYDSIISSPKNVIDRIYNFLDIPNFNHNLNNIEQKYKNSTNFLNSLHEVRNKISIREKTDYIETLSDDTRDLILSYDSFWINNINNITQTG